MQGVFSSSSNSTAQRLSDNTVRVQQQCKLLLVSASSGRPTLHGLSCSSAHRNVITCAATSKPAGKAGTNRSSSSSSSKTASNASEKASSRSASSSNGRRNNSSNAGRKNSSSSSSSSSSTIGRKDSNSSSSSRPVAPRSSKQQRYQGAEDDSTGSWRLFSLKVPADEDPGKDDISIHPALQAVIAKRLLCKPAAVEALVAQGGVKMMRKSFDPRRDVKRAVMEKHFVYIVDVTCAGLKAAGINQQRLVPKDAWLERMPADLEAGTQQHAAPSSGDAVQRLQNSAPVVVVGTGPAGLFAALEMAQAGIKVVLIERGQPVEQRGRDLGAFFVRGVLNPDSNLCYGEGGAGTWSDGKLTTRIGRNSEPVRRVLQAFVQYGAPESILVAGKPHLGTERLVRLLKAFRADLQSLGVDIRFGTTVKDILVQGSRCTGVVLADGSHIPASSVVLAVGHSARPLYKVLLDHGVTLKAKSFAMGFRIEHPQSLIDTIRYGSKDAAGVMRGKGRIPVADYTLAATVLDSLDCQSAGTSSSSSSSRSQQNLVAAVAADPGMVDLSSSSSSSGGCCDARVAAAGSNQDAGERGVYSFCMCPGGQIVCTSTNEQELCINGMSFSRRNSAWANSALVVSMQPQDWQHLEAEHGALAGMALQVQYERLGAQMGGGKFVAPVQRVTDFLQGVESRGELPSSSYRLGVRPGPLHELYDGHMTAALRRALDQFDRRLPGFIGPEALLHGVETRTSAPVRIERHEDSLESVSLEGLYPCGEGAGYAGGIVSAAVDGLRVGEAVVARMLSEVP